MHFQNLIMDLTILIEPIYLGFGIFLIFTMRSSGVAVYSILKI